jgi:hypothetical protein
VQTKVVTQTPHRPRHAWVIAFLIGFRGPSPYPVLGAVQIWKIPLSANFRIFQPGGPGLVQNGPYCSAPRAMCKGITLFCKTSHRVQLLTARVSPETAWPRALIALPSTFALKRDTKPVGGRGISAFSDVFFLVAGFSAEQRLLFAARTLLLAPRLQGRPKRRTIARTRRLEAFIQNHPKECSCICTKQQ